MVDKKKGEMTLATIIAIVLGITVLVFLIFGFTTGWNNMWEQVMGRTTGSNVKLVVADCENDCRAGEDSSWCNEIKELRYIGVDGKTVKAEGTCNQFFSGLTTSEGVDLPDGLGFEKCASISVCGSETSGTAPII